MFFECFALYLCFISFIAVVITVSDKVRAKKGKRRIRERTLFLISFLGGAAFMYVTMLLIRHKTLHLKFMLGLPVIIAFQVFMAYFAVQYL